jgi:uncharacterized membrane protein YqjE
MSRAGNQGPIVVKATNNIYTALVASAVVLQIVGLIYVVWTQAMVLHGKPLLP